jgi:hypothetical protein
LNTKFPIFCYNTIGGFKVSDAIGLRGAKTLGRARGQRHSPYYFLLGVGKLRLHNLVNFCKDIKESFNFTSCYQFLGIFWCLSVRVFVRIKGLEVLKYGEFVGSCLLVFSIVYMSACIWKHSVASSFNARNGWNFAEHKYLSYRKPHGVQTCNLISLAPCRCYFVSSKPVLSGVA